MKEYVLMFLRLFICCLVAQIALMLLDSDMKNSMFLPVSFIICLVFVIVRYIYDRKKDKK